jgi:hypothetical protein
VTAVTGEGGRQHESVVDFFKGDMDGKSWMANTLPIIVSIGVLPRGGIIIGRTAYLDRSKNGLMQAKQRLKACSNFTGR